jgi:GTP-binding protein
VIVHVIDVGQLALEGRDPLFDYETIRKELGSYDPDILKHHEIIALSKVDLLAEADEALAPIEKVFHNMGRDVFRISSATKLGIRELIAGMARALDATEALENKKEAAR